MHLDVRDLVEFYYRTRLGGLVRLAIRDRVADFWPNTETLTVAGFGFATPALRPYLGKAGRMTILMPAPQGVMNWPDGEAGNLSVLCGETRWPMADDSVDRLLVLHGLETSESPGRLLGECRRVLAPEGSALFIVPNRTGLWARRDRTPFGHGRPYSLGQFEAFLEAHGLEAVRHEGALHAPPSERRFWLRTFGLWERLGCYLPGGRAGGVLMVETTIRTPKSSGSAVRDRILAPIKVFDAAAKPGPARPGVIRRRGSAASETNRRNPPRRGETSTAVDFRGAANVVADGRSRR